MKTKILKMFIYSSLIIGNIALYNGFSFELFKENFAWNSFIGVFGILMAYQIIKHSEENKKMKKNNEWNEALQVILKEFEDSMKITNYMIFLVLPLFFGWVQMTLGSTFNIHSFLLTFIYIVSGFASIVLAVGFSVMKTINTVLSEKLPKINEVDNITEYGINILVKERNEETLKELDRVSSFFSVKKRKSMPLETIKEIKKEIEKINIWKEEREYLRNTDTEDIILKLKYEKILELLTKKAH